jgi:hypothetical protein
VFSPLQGALYLCNASGVAPSPAYLRKRLASAIPCYMGNRKQAEHAHKARYCCWVSMEQSMATSMPSPPMLPVLPTVRVAYMLVFMHWKAALKISWAWLVILAVVAFVIFMPIMTFGRAEFVPVFLLVVLLLSIHLFGMSSIAVAWHRLILLREAPAIFNLRVDGQVPRYAWGATLIALVAFMVHMACSYLVATFTDIPFTLAPKGFLRFLISLPVILVVSRLAIALPAAAVDRPLQLRQAVARTKGNTWRLFTASLLISMPAYFFSLMIAPTQGSGFLLRGIAALLLYAINFVLGFACLSFLSLIYHVFVGPPQEHTN